MWTELSRNCVGVLIVDQISVCVCVFNGPTVENIVVLFLVLFCFVLYFDCYNIRIFWFYLGILLVCGFDNANIRLFSFEENLVRETPEIVER